MAQLRRLRQMFPDTLVVIGVHSAKFPSEKLTENIRRATASLGITHPVVNDAGFLIWDAYAVRAWPTLVLIDPEGRVAKVESGEVLAEQLAPEIERLVTEHAGALDRTPLELAAPPSEPVRPLRYPGRVLPTEDGYLFIADSGHHRIVQVRLEADGLAGQVERVFGSGAAGLVDGPAGEAAFHHPRGLALLGSSTGSETPGRLYVADTENHAVRAIDLASGAVRTVAGTGEKAHGRYAVTAPTATPLRSPWAVAAFDRYVFIAMAGSHQIWVLIDEQELGPFAGNGYEALVDGPLGQSSFNQPSDLEFGYGHLFIADAEASAIRAVAFTEQPQVLTLVGQGLFDYGDVDGVGAEVRLQHAAGLAVSEMAILIADTYNHKIKRLDLRTNRVETLVGTGQPGLQDGAFGKAQLYHPEGVRAAGNLAYIADTNNHTIRVADLAAGQVSILRLKGLEKLKPPAVAAGMDMRGVPITGQAVAQARPGRAGAGRMQAERLGAVYIRPGNFLLEFQVEVPAGHKLNPDAPSTVRVAGQEPVELGSDGRASVPVRVEAPAELDIDLTVYSCETTNQNLCLIHDRRLTLPVEPKEGVEPPVVHYTIHDSP